MEMEIENVDLPVDIEEKEVEILKEKEIMLESNNKIEKCALGYARGTRSIISKVIEKPPHVSEVMNEDLMKSVEKEVIISYKVKSCLFKNISGDSEIVPIRYSKMSSEFVMNGIEYCTSGSLEQYVNGRNGEIMDEFLIKSLAYQILSAMFDYIEKETVYLDIQPENILINSHGEIKLLDLELIGDINGQSKFSTRRYLSPELKDNVPLSIKSSIWSFGVVLLELAYGRDVYRDSAILRMDSSKIGEEFGDRGGYSKEMSDFLRKCFDREGSDRASVEELLQDKWFDGVKINSPTPVIKLAEESKSSPPIAVIRSGSNNKNIYNYCNIIELVIFKIWGVAFYLK